MQPVIGITVGEVINLDTGVAWTPTIYGQFRTYTDAVVGACGAPFILPLIDDETVLRKLYEHCAGLLLSGGHDLAATADDGPPKVKVSISPRRDKQEMRLLKWALEDDKPVLGICRGMQLINVALGGSLYRDIDSDLPAARSHTANIDKKDFHHLAHRLELKPGSQLASILKSQRVATNTLHHQAIKQLGDGLVATAHAEDSVIEAIELPGKRFVIGVQSHPEALQSGAEPLWRVLFTAFVRSAATGV